jgi:hypothetical protein
MKLEMFNKNGRKRKIALVIPIIVLFFRHNNPCKPNGFDLKQFMKDATTNRMRFPYHKMNLSKNNFNYVR